MPTNETGPTPIGPKLPKFAYRARRGSFKKRGASVERELDYFGPRYAAALKDWIQAARISEEDLRDAFIAKTGDLFTSIILLTPVDTGRARGGWQIESSETAGGGIHIEIFNSVPYIIYLEFGWSTQAPRGMVRISLAQFARNMQRETAKIARS